MSKNIKYFPIFWFSILLFSGCQMKKDRYSEQIEVTRKLFLALRNSDTTEIRNMLAYGYDDSDDFTFQSMASIGYLKKIILNCNLNGSEDLGFNEYPSDSPKLVDIIIKPCEPYSMEGNIIVSFVKYSDSRLIFGFEFQRNAPINVEDFSPLE